MPRPPRHCDPDKYYLLTNRTHRAKFLMQPDSVVRQIILGCLARWADFCNVEIVCFVFLGNHFHLIARFPDRNMSKFAGNLQSQIGKRINDYRGRSGNFWHDRFKPIPILDDAMLKEKIAYVINNAVKHRLVSCADRWPGVCSIDWHKTGAAVEGEWLNKSERRRKQRKGLDNPGELAMEDYAFELHLPEALGGESEEGRREKLLELVEDHRERLEKERRTDRAGVVGARTIKRRHWNDRPEDPDKAPAPICLTSDPEKREAYLEKRRRITESYRMAVETWRSKRLSKFPAGTIPPGWNRYVNPGEYVHIPEDRFD